MTITDIAEIICIIIMVIGFLVMYGSKAERKQLTIGLVLLTVGLVADLIIAGVPFMAMFCLLGMIAAYFFARRLLW